MAGGEEAEGRCCAVLGCTNSGGGLREWRAGECEQHRPLLRADCPCLEPFCFYGFPSGAEERGRWLRALRGRGLRLEAGAGAAVCSLHLEEGALLLGLGLRKKPAADQVAPPPAAPAPTTVETRSSRARKRRHPGGPRPWLPREPAAAAAATTAAAAAPRSWEQAAVQAIMRLRCASSQRVARALIACLKGENDHLRQRSRQLEAALGTTARQLERLQRECRCRHRPGAEARPPPPLPLQAGDSPEIVPSSEVTVG